MTSSTRMWHIALSQSIDGIAYSVAAQLSEQANMQKSLMHHFESMAVQMATLLDNRTVNGNITPDPPNREGIPPAGGIQLNTVPNPVELPGMSAQLTALRGLKIRVQQHYRCSRVCSCICHDKYQVRTPRTVATLMGSFQLSWSKSNRKQNICDQRDCRSRSKK